LYGDYWVDRPPLLIWLFSLASHLGPIGHSAAGPTAPGVKLLGAVAAGLSVILTGLLGGLVTPGSGSRRAASVLLTAALLSSPLIGMPETDGEILAVPVVLLGLVCTVGSLRTPDPLRAVLLAAAAGGSGACAALVKQNVIDVVVFGLAVLVVARGRIAAPRRMMAAFLAGGLAGLAVVVTAGASRGTSPGALWDAVVVFRVRASAVIGASASEATPERLGHLAEAFLASGAAGLLLACLVPLGLAGRRARCPSVRETTQGPDAGPLLAWPVVAMVAWELCAIAVGGSYWLHYLTGLVPGLVMLVLALPRNRCSGRLVTAALAYVAVVNIAVWGYQATAAMEVSTEAQVGSYLRAHANPADGLVVAFGHPDIVAGSGLTSPYPQLWSLPVRVRDPDLRALRSVMAGRHAPRWIVVAGESLDSWGLDTHAAQAYFERHYREQVSYGDWHVWRRNEGQ